jgi:hypothetical protein
MYAIAAVVGYDSTALHAQSNIRYALARILRKSA